MGGQVLRYDRIRDGSSIGPELPAPCEPGELQREKQQGDRHFGGHIRKLPSGNSVNSRPRQMILLPKKPSTHVAKLV